MQTDIFSTETVISKRFYIKTIVKISPFEIDGNTTEPGVY